MVYEVKYKLKGQYFWRSIKNVKGDGIVNDNTAHRFLITSDEGRVEIPVDGTVFKFGPQRFLIIKQNMEQEAGISIPVKS